MNTKRNVAGTLSLAVLLLLPAFAAGAQRKAEKKAALPRPGADSSGFRAFTKPVASAESETIQEAAEVSAPSGQSLGGAGVSVGAGNAAASAGAIGSSSSKGSSNPGKLTNNSSPAPSGSGNDFCAQQGLANAEMLIDWSSGYLKPFILNGNQSMSFKMGVTPGSGVINMASVYDGGRDKISSFSKYKCDFSPSLGACLQDGRGTEVRAYATVSGSQYSNQHTCNLTPGETYYLNIRNVSAQFVPQWSGPPGWVANSGTFWLHWSGIPGAPNAPNCCFGNGHPMDCSSCKPPNFVSVNTTARVTQTANPPPPQPPSSTCWIGTSGAGSWRLYTAPLEVSPPPPPCDACVAAGGHCAPGSSCMAAGGVSHYSCE